MIYGQFYDIANELNSLNKNIFNQKEIAIFAYEYLCEYEYAKANCKPTKSLIELVNLIVETVAYYDCVDYAELDNKLDFETMEKILLDFYYEI